MEVILDVSRRCIHKCIYCYFHHFGLSDNRRMEPEVFVDIYEILKREVNKVYLYMSGEPFLNSHIYSYIALLGHAGIDVEIATKLSVGIDFKSLKESLKEFTKSKCKFLVGHDSCSQETINKISSNMNLKSKGINQQRLMALKSKNVIIQYSSIKTAYNENEGKKPMGIFQHHLYKKAGIDIRKFIPHSGSRLRKNGTIKDGRCKFLGVPAISVDGDLLLCCHDFLYDTKSGNVIKEGSIKRLLKSDLYKANCKKGRKKMFNVCKDCC